MNNKLLKIKHTNTLIRLISDIEEGRLHVEDFIDQLTKLVELLDRTSAKYMRGQRVILTHPMHVAILIVEGYYAEDESYSFVGLGNDLYHESYVSPLPGGQL